MPRTQIKHEIESLILLSGHPADKRMQCSLQRIIRMRHPELGAQYVHDVIAECLGE